MTFVSTASKGGGGGMTRITSSVLTGTAASIDIPNITQAYRHLRLYIVGRVDAAVVSQTAAVTVNGDGGGNYTSQSIINTTASSVGSQEQVSGATSWQIYRLSGASDTANHPGMAVIDFPEYSTTGFFKTCVSSALGSYGSATAQRNVGLYAGVWLNTAAITRITLGSGGGNFIAGTTVTLYGII